MVTVIFSAMKLSVSDREDNSYLGKIHPKGRYIPRVGLMMREWSKTLSWVRCIGLYKLLADHVMLHFLFHRFSTTVPGTLKFACPENFRKFDQDGDLSTFKWVYECIMISSRNRYRYYQFWSILSSKDEGHLEGEEVTDQEEDGKAETHIELGTPGCQHLIIPLLVVVLMMIEILSRCFVPGNDPVFLGL